MNKYTKSTTTVYKNPFFQILKKEIEMPNGRLVTHYVHHQPLPFVVIIGIQGDEVLLSRQWRPVIQDWNWEFPMGGLDTDEPAEDAAERELLEETGYSCETATEIGSFLVGSGHTDQRGIVCIATKLSKQKEQELEASELIEVSWIKIADFEKMVKQGTIIDGPTLASWQIYKLKHYNKRSRAQDK